ncbi:glutamyl-tRNA(Gln) amidotransferase subunit A, mitochondrial-like isoform X2 [Dreissena polymorpha]|uniref:glutamyl-tRNA(Gln) amidotransferase subunit A, mitochondrial-like isoform X2 n=1 Tax=Dreissena polymorpha TaxID=45954 RepID=UPI00226452BB|nr:glutamyl-tRNA(Gln) amidotransferase subunit A, mitochondrial-like isoform X2 [Dreissena polymorpha]
MLSLSLREVLHLIKTEQISARDLLKKCIERATSVRELNAYITETHELAWSQVGLAPGKSELAGIPIAVKDNFCTRNIPTTCGSKMLDNYVPPYNATVVDRLLTSGAVLMGKTNMDEYAMGSSVIIQSKEGPTSGGDWYIAGGSSGGSAVAVATGTCFGALGSDTGGSTRNPASYCGIVGLKPTYGSLSRYGLIPLVNSLDVPGILTKTVDDAALLLRIIAGRDVNDSTTVSESLHLTDLDDQPSVKGLHIGIPKEYNAPGLCGETRRAWEDVANALETAGACVSLVSLPHTQYSINTYSILCACEVASNMARYDGIEFGHRAEGNNMSTESLYAQSRHEGFNEVVRGRIFAGNYFLLRKNYRRYFQQALKVRRLISDDFTKVYGDGVDVLLTPTTLSVALPYSKFSMADNRTRTAEQDYFTQPINMAGLPAVSIPVRLSESGLPISLQVVGQRFKDRVMLNTAKWIEMNTNFQKLNLDYLDS